MNKMKTAIGTTAWCMCLLCSFSGCNGEDTATRQATNKQEVPVTINLNQAAWGTEQSAQYTKAPSQEVSIPVKGGVLTATLEPAAPAQTRSTEINYGVRYRLIAYKENDVSFTGYVNHADFVKGGVAPTFWLQTDRTYTLVCYSFNSADTIPEFNRIYIIPENDFLYGKKNVTITAENRSIDMEMQHLFSQVTVIADASADAEGYTISACSGTLSPNYTIFFFLDGTSSNMNIIKQNINWTSFGTVAVSSTPAIIHIPQKISGTRDLELTLDSITIDGTTIKNSIFYFRNILQPGYRYTLRVKFESEYRDCTIKWASGNLIYTNGIYSFATKPEYYSGIWNGGDYWNWRVLSPTDNTGFYNEYTPSANDPCKKVDPAGTWRMPKKEEFDKLKESGYIWANKNGIAGMYFGTTTIPAAGTEKNYVFLPAAGQRNPGDTAINIMGEIGFYWSATPANNESAYQLLFYYFMGNNASIGLYGRNNGFAVRCVSEQ